MAKYEEGDLVTYYFVVKDDHQNDMKIIKGWTDSKVLAETYIKLHNCPHYHLKKVTKTIEEIRRITEENHNDEIVPASVITRKRKKKGKHDQDFERITIVATQTEMDVMGSEYHTFMSGHVDYGYLNQVLPYLKKKYQSALNCFFLPSVIKKTCANHEDKKIQFIELDQLMILVKAFPDDFG